MRNVPTFRYVTKSNVMNKWSEQHATMFNWVRSELFQCLALLHTMQTTKSPETFIQAWNRIDIAFQAASESLRYCRNKMLLSTSRYGIAKYDTAMIQKMLWKTDEVQKKSHDYSIDGYPAGISPEPGVLELNAWGMRILKNTDTTVCSHVVTETCQFLQILEKLQTTTDPAEFKQAWVDLLFFVDLVDLALSNVIDVIHASLEIGLDQDEEVFARIQELLSKSVQEEDHVK